MQALDPLPCASCGGPLHAAQTPHGLLWRCEPCTAVATTLGVLRRVAPRRFVQHVWQAALHCGRPSPRPCPSCTQPLLALRPPEVEMRPAMDICCRCFLIWLDVRAWQELEGRELPRLR